MTATVRDTKEDQFTVGGTQAGGNDSIGPSVYCYLNSPSFTNGDDVNSTPYFVAEITDKDGINTTGNGIGHDLELTIDGLTAMTYNLNGNFQYDFGSYTSGTTYYSIPELTEGKHTLKFRAWDILNNSTTTELTFNVVKGIGAQHLQRELHQQSRHHANHLYHQPRPHRKRNGSGTRSVRLCRATTMAAYRERRFHQRQLHRELEPYRRWWRTAANRRLSLSRAHWLRRQFESLQSTEIDYLKQ